MSSRVRRRTLPAVACAAAASILAPAAAQPAAAPATLERIEGRVLDGLSRPLPVADVWVTDADDKVVGRATTDAEGLFVIAKLPARPFWTVRATAPGRTEGLDRMRPRGGVATTQLKLYDAATLTGRVVGPTGDGLAGAEVIASFNLSRTILGDGRTGTTDAEGRFRIDKVPLGVIDVRAAAAGFVCAGERVHVNADREVEVKLAPGDGLAIEVEVEGLTAEEAAAVRISLRPYDQRGLVRMPPRLVNGRLDDKGRWSARGLPERQYFVTPHAPGLSFQPGELEMYPQFRQTMDRVLGPNVKPTTSPSARFRVFRTTEVALKGRLLDDKGEGLAGETLVTRARNGSNESTAVTGEGGAFTIQSPLAPGTEAVFFLRGSQWVTDQKPAEDQPYFDVRDYAWHRAKVDPQAELVIRAMRATVVRGKLVDAAGAPARFARLQLEEATDNRMPRWISFAYGVTRADGSFEFRVRTLAQPARVQVQGEAGFLESGEIALAAGATLELGELKLSPPATIAGVVYDSRQKPVAGARVWLRDWDLGTGMQKSGSVAEAVTDREGRYRFTEVPPGGAYLQVTLAAEHLLDRAVEPFEVKPGEGLTFDLVVSER